MRPEAQQAAAGDLASGRAVEVGFYGKLPSHGDFLSRRVPDAFVGVWDGWLQDCLAASQAALGSRWLDVYLTSPAWRFVSARGACGTQPVIGLLVPSVDRVGRYFPLTLVAELPSNADILAIAADSALFFESAERLVIETLEAEHVDFESFDARLLGLGSLLGPVGSPTWVLDAAAASILADASPPGWQITMGSPPALANVFAQVMSQRLSALYDPLVLWWTEGSSVVVPSCLVVKGLPHPEMFAALLDGSWGERRWHSVTARADAASAPDDGLVDDVTAPRCRSMALSDVGRARELNEDSFLERPEVGLWVVADGLGGHSDGEVASRMVCDALAAFVPAGSFEDMIDDVRRRVADVNDHLQRAANRPVSPVRSGSTIAALMVRGSRCAILWAGDSRVYRWRDGLLAQLTRDHSVAADGPPGSRANHAITRAVGGEPTLNLDLHRDRVRAGDRFLLCSDGLTRVVPDAQIRAWMERADVRGVADGLVKATLDGGAPDNVTVLVVEAFS